MSTEPKLYGGHTLAEIKEWTNCAMLGECVGVMFCDLLAAAEECENLRNYLDDELKRKIVIQEHNDQLRAENERLRALLKGVLDCISETRGKNADEAVYAARRALEETK